MSAYRTLYVIAESFAIARPVLSQAPGPIFRPTKYLPPLSKLVGLTLHPPVLDRRVGISLPLPPRAFGGFSDRKILFFGQF